MLNRAKKKAQAALFKGQEYFEADLYEQALNGDSIGFAGFAKIADEYSGTKAANLAKSIYGYLLRSQDNTKLL